FMMASIDVRGVAAEQRVPSRLWLHREPAGRRAVGSESVPVTDQEIQRSVGCMGAGCESEQEDEGRDEMSHRAMLSDPEPPQKSNRSSQLPEPWRRERRFGFFLTREDMGKVMSENSSGRTWIARRRSTTWRRVSLVRPERSREIVPARQSRSFSRVAWET